MNRLIMNPIIQEACINCRFMRVHEGCNDKEWLACHKNPPAFDEDHCGTWAQVMDHDWCGAWAVNPKMIKGYAA